MKGAIEYLRAVRDLCDGGCKNCDLFVSCPFVVQPKLWTDEKILRMLKGVEGIKHERQEALREM